jgi:hypothetical protein
VNRYGHLLSKIRNIIHGYVSFQNANFTYVRDNHGKKKQENVDLMLLEIITALGKKFLTSEKGHHLL